MGVLEVAFALKLTQGNRVGLAAPGKSPLPSRADDVRAATAEQQQVACDSRAYHGIHLIYPLSGRGTKQYTLACTPGALT